MIPAVIIGGYLGSGKTTLINRILAGQHGRRITVLVNDFGAVNIDADLIDNRSGDTISLTNGCACCTIGDDLILAAERAASADPSPDLIIVEASGAAEPARMAVNLLGAGKLQAASLLTIIDGSTVLTRMKDKFVGQLVCRQIAQANRLLVNRMHSDAEQNIFSTVGRNGSAFLSGFAGVERWIFGADCAADGLIADRPANDAAVHHGLKSVVIPFDGPVPVRHLETCRAGMSGNVHRVKGIVAVRDDAGESRWLEIQYDGGRWHSRPGNARSGGQLVVIGTFDRLEGDRIIKQWQAVGGG